MKGRWLGDIIMLLKCKANFFSFKQAFQKMSFPLKIGRFSQDGKSLIANL
jgi:hypothetical protein